MARSSATCSRSTSSSCEPNRKWSWLLLVLLGLPACGADRPSERAEPRDDAAAAGRQRRQEAEERRKRNYSLIEDGLYVGGWVSKPPPGTRAVLNVCETKDPYQAEVHRWEPIDDAPPAPSLDWLRQQVKFVDSQRRAGLPTYVHCYAGISRGPMVVIAYLMHQHGWKRDEALAFVRSKRDIVQPNDAFMELLLDWEQKLKAKK